MVVKKESSIQRYIGASTDTKPTGATVPVGSTFLEYDTSEMYITYDGTNWVKKVIVPFNTVRTVRAIKTLEATAIYHVGDVLSEDSSAGVATSWAFRGVVDGKGGSGVITHLQCMTETPSASGDIILDLYNAIPTCSLTDHDLSHSPLYADMTASKFLGRIQTTKLISVGASGGAFAIATSETASSGLPLPFVCTSATNAIYGVAACITALGVVASSDMMFTMQIEKR